MSDRVQTEAEFVGSPGFKLSCDKRLGKRLGRSQWFCVSVEPAWTENGWGWKATYHHPVRGLATIGCAPALWAGEPKPAPLSGVHSSI